MYKLLRAEWYRLIHTKSYWALLCAALALNGFLMAGSFYRLPAGAFLAAFIPKDAMSILLSGLLSGLLLGRDFADRTVQQSIMAGTPRNTLFIAKAIVFLLAATFLMLAFPLLATLVMGHRNGWDVSTSQLSAQFVALAALYGATASVGLMGAFCTQNLAASIMVTPLWFCGCILMLNSPMNPQFSRVLPMGMERLVISGQASVGQATLLAGCWIAGCMAISALLFRRAELK